jgi:hypothetical protein
MRLLVPPWAVAQFHVFPINAQGTPLEGTVLVSDDRALAFIQRHLKSVWGLELLLLFHSRPEQEWRRDALVRELRASEVVVNEALSQLKSARVVNETPERVFKYAPDNDFLRETVSEIADIYATRPVAVVKAISAAPSEKLKIFLDAFKIRDS